LFLAGVTLWFYIFSFNFSAFSHSQSPSNQIPLAAQLLTLSVATNDQRQETNMSCPAGRLTGILKIDILPSLIAGKTNGKAPMEQN